jgi:hypothetical protein
MCSEGRFWLKSSCQQAVHGPVPGFPLCPWITDQVDDQVKVFGLAPVFDPCTAARSLYSITSSLQKGGRDGRSQSPSCLGSTQGLLYRESSARYCAAVTITCEAPPRRGTI